MLLLLLEKWTAAVPEDKLILVETIEYPVKLEVPEACRFIFERVLKPPQTKKYVKATLATLFRSVCTLGAKHKLPAASPPFASLLRATMMHWINAVMGPRPNPDLLRPALRDLDRQF